MSTLAPEKRAVKPAKAKPATVPNVEKPRPLGIFHRRKTTFGPTCQLRPVRVGFVLHVMQVAGAEVLVAETIRRLQGEIVPTVFCLDGIGPIGEQLQAEGVEVVNLGRKPGLDWRCGIRLAREVRSRRIQILHAHQYTPFFYSALAKAYNRGGFKLILTEHGRHFPDLVSPARRAINRLLLSQAADTVNACCGFSANALTLKDGFPGRHIEVIENGIDLRRYRNSQNREALRKKLGLSPKRQYIAMVARFHPVKDHAMLLRAFARVAAVREDVDLLLAGDGPLRSDLLAQSSELGISERVKFLGVRSDVPDLLQAIDVFALTSASEAASLTLLEAMASSRPVVVTEVGGNPEIIRDGVEGRLVPRGDDTACAQALLSLLHDPEASARMGQAGRKRVESAYQLHRTVERYRQLYRRLVSSH